MRRDRGAVAARAREPTSNASVQREAAGGLARVDAADFRATFRGERAGRRRHDRCGRYVGCAMAAALFEPITADLQVRLLHPGAVAPRRAHGHDAGYDLACVEDFTLWPARRRTVGTGVAIALPPGVAGLVTPRSGLAARHGITIVNAPGLVDPGYRGELRVTLLNTGDAPHAARAGDRIAQLVLIPFVAPEVHVVEDLDGGPDARGELGFGSSGR